MVDTTSFNNTRGTNVFVNEAEAQWNFGIFRTKPFGSFDPDIVRAELEHLAARGCEQLRVHGSYWGWFADKDDWMSNFAEYCSYCAYFGIKIQYSFLEGVIGSARLRTVIGELWYDPIGDAGARTYNFASTSRKNPAVDVALEAIKAEDRAFFPSIGKLPDDFLLGGWVNCPGDLFTVAFDFPVYPALFTDPRGPGPRQTAIRDMFSSLQDYFTEIIDEMDYWGVTYAIEVANEPDIAADYPQFVYSASFRALLNNQLYNEFAVEAGRGGTILRPTEDPNIPGEFIRDEANEATIQARNRTAQFLNWFHDWVHATYPHITTIGWTGIGVFLGELVHREADREDVTSVAQQYHSFHEYGDHFFFRGTGELMRFLKEDYASHPTRTPKGFAMSEFFRVDPAGDLHLLEALYTLQFDRRGASPVRDDVGGFMWGYYESNGFAYNFGQIQNWEPSPGPPPFNGLPATGITRSRKDPNTGVHTITERRSDMDWQVERWFKGLDMAKPAILKPTFTGGTFDFRLDDRDGTAMATTASTKVEWRYAIIRSGQVSNENFLPIMKIYPAIGFFIDVPNTQSKYQTGTSAHEVTFSVTESQFTHEDSLLFVQAAYGETDYDVSSKQGWIDSEWNHSLVAFFDQAFLFGERRGQYFRGGLWDTDPVSETNESFIPTSMVISFPLVPTNVAWSWDDTTKEVTLTNGLGGSGLTDRAMLLLKDVRYRERPSFRMGFTLHEDTSTGLGLFVGFVFNYSIQKGTGYILYVSKALNTAVIAKWDTSFSSVALVSASITIDEHMDISASMEQIPNGIRLRMFVDGTAITWAGSGDDFYDDIPPVFRGGYSGIAVSNFTTGGETVTLKDFYVSATDMNQVINTPTIECSGQQTPTKVGVTAKSSGYEPGALGDLHDSSRWVIVDASSSWETPDQDTEWSTISKVAKAFTSLEPRTLYRLRVKYRNDDLEESPWSEPSLFSLDGTSGEATTFDVGPFPPELPIYQGFQEFQTFATIITELDESGRITSKARRDVPVRGFSLNFPGITSAQASCLLDHFSKARGRFAAFEFIHPRSGEVVPVRYEDDEMTLELFASVIYRGRISLIEDLGTKVSQLASFALGNKDQGLQGGQT